jgi:hypothetical protein
MDKRDSSNIRLTYKEPKDKSTNKCADETFPGFLGTKLDEGCSTPKEATYIRKNVVANYQAHWQNKPGKNRHEKEKVKHQLPTYQIIPSNMLLMIK